MRKYFLLQVTALGLLTASCAPAAPPTGPAPTTAPPKVETPATRPAAAPALSPTPKPSADQPRYGGTLVMASRHKIPHFDMHQEVTTGIILPLAPTYSNLLQPDPRDENRIIGDLARSWEISPDGRVYTLRLNEGVKFHDGKPLTSEDVKFNLDRVAFPPRGMVSSRKALFQAVEKIEAPDPLTARITLKNPQGSFLQILAFEETFIFASHVLKQKGDMKKDVMGSGPFKFASYTPDVSFKSVKNPDYFIKGRPYLDGIAIYIVVDEMARFAALRTKQVLMVPLVAGPTGAQAREMQKAEPKLVVQDRLAPNVTTMIFNTEKEPWNDIRVRQAVNLAIDREAGAKVIRAGDYFPGYGYMLPGSPWALPESELMALPGFRKPKDPDVAEARKLLAEAGHPQGFKTTVLTSTTVHAKEAGEFSKSELAKIGITADMQLVDTTTITDRMFKGSFEVSVFADSAGLEDPDSLLGEFYLASSPKNYGRWSNAELERLFAVQNSALDANKRKEAVWEMQRIVHREAPRIIFTWAKWRAIWWDEIKDWIPGSSVKRNHKFQDVWLAR
ncbi:MAG: ABC transporter substrate-binding protein [Chloroflexi bacterium]|nr:ABC transporter substrate-binding protein [Chloroflexota bacterium]